MKNTHDSKSEGRYREAVITTWTASLLIATYVSMDVESPLPPFQTYLALAGVATLVVAIFERAVIPHV